MTPVNTKQLISVVEDAIAFEKAAACAGIPSKQARALAAELGALPVEQLQRICLYAAEERRTALARADKKQHRRTR